MNKNIYVFVFLLATLFACKHYPTIIGDEDKVTSSTIDVKVDSTVLSTLPQCPIVDDIIVSGSTTFQLGPVVPSGQGTANIDNNHCLVWTSNGQTDIIRTYIIACNSAICDTTFYNILPPLPIDPMGIPCSPDTVYFERDILPILTQSCAFQGCHNAASHKEGVILDKYTNILKEVKVGNPSNSDLYKSITQTSASKIMPPPPATKLSPASIALIKKWIEQGAKNLKCDNITSCDTLAVSYNTFVKPSIAACVTCHRSGNVGGGINLENYEGVKASIANNRLIGSITWSNNYKPMPQGGAKLPDCTIKKIKSWVNQGGKNN